MKTQEQIKDLRVVRVLYFFIGFVTALIFLSLNSCSTHYVTNYKIETPKGNFYTNDYVIKNDSIFIIEYLNRGKYKDSIRRRGSFKLSEVKFNN
jgi:hypothetical protein